MAMFGIYQLMSIGFHQIAFGTRQFYGPIVIYNDFATRLSAILSERNMSKADLGRGADIPYHRLNEWFRKEIVTINGPDLTAISTFLGVPASYLLYGQPSLELSGRVQAIRDRLENADTSMLDDVESYLDYLETKQRTRTSD